MVLNNGGIKFANFLKGPHKNILELLQGFTDRNHFRGIILQEGYFSNLWSNKTIHIYGEINIEYISFLEGIK
jgi:hypothetical protein